MTPSLKTIGRTAFYIACLAAMSGCTVKKYYSSPSSTVSAETNGSAQTLVSMNRVSTGLNGCASGAGVQLNSGLDTNRNSKLDSSEITSTQILCDGANGATGSQGSTGANGHSLVFSVMAATAQECAAGGSLIVMASDINDNGVFDPADTNQQSTVLCNGAPAQTAAYTPVEPITPCGMSVPYKEVLLRLSNGQVLASFSDNVSGQNTRLILMSDGTYQDTDNSSCVFTLSTSQDGSTRSISWDNAVQESWSL